MLPIAIVRQTNNAIKQIFLVMEMVPTDLKELLNQD